MPASPGPSRKTLKGNHKDTKDTKARLQRRAANLTGLAVIIRRAQRALRVLGALVVKWVSKLALVPTFVWARGGGQCGRLKIEQLCQSTRSAEPIGRAGPLSSEETFLLLD
jgi:hypothetical protein